jgi:predicted DsbA family dithiol-disulfide isomerase
MIPLAPNPPTGPEVLAIDIVSDVSCPWCVIGILGLEAALGRCSSVVSAVIRLHPFELNPDMGPEGQGLAEHVAQKYGTSPDRSKGVREMIRTQGEALGFCFNTGPDSRIYNTFEAHRLLHWAGLAGRQLPLKHALFKAYFTDGQNPGDHRVLIQAARNAGLDPAAAEAVLSSGAYGEAVRQGEEFWRREGVSAVPTMIINQRFMITGAQPVAALERALRSIAADARPRQGVA